MKNLLLYINLLLACSLLPVSTSAQESEPVVHDPVLIEADGMYYMFCTGRGISAFSSPDMETWTKLEPVFAEAPEWAESVVPEFKNHIWAPDVMFHNGVYYLYYSVSAFAKNTSAMGVATNKTLDPKNPDFKWTDHGIVIQSHPNRDFWNAIDPNLVFDENDTPWLSFGSFWGGLKLVKMSEDLLSIAEPQEWYTIARRKRSFDLDVTDPGDGAIEAPFIFKKDGYYYLFISLDLCCRGKESTYKVAVGRSKTVKGPYLDRDGVQLDRDGGSLVVQGNENWYGAGHTSTYTFDGVDYLVFHAYDASTEKGVPKLKIKPLKWIDGWPELAEPLK